LIVIIIAIVKTDPTQISNRKIEDDIHLSLSTDEQERYLRQILIFGNSGQISLRNAHIFIAGCGGLGSPIAMYLAAAGVGKLTIVDHDRVSLSNLNRQLLHGTSDVGREKIISAEEKLREINPEIILSCQNSLITHNTISTLASGADIIIDAVDSIETRHVLNVYAVRTGLPYMYGSVQGFSGQMMVIMPGKTACLRCLMNTPPKLPVVPVLGITPGIIGLMQANEAIKLITGIGKVQAGIFITWDGETGKLDSYAVKKDPRCPVCGNAEILENGEERN
jgi:adenylyltransferase/sulfurtransferase